MQDREEDEEVLDTFPGVRGMVKTPKALVCLFPEWGGDKGVRVVVPDSVIHSDSEVFGVAHVGKLVVKGWWTDSVEYAHMVWRKGFNTKFTALRVI